MKWPWRKPPPRRADPLRIAVLEYELLDIEPKPGTAAALAVGLRRAFGPHLGERPGEIDLPGGIRSMPLDHFTATYERTGTNCVTVPKPSGGVEVLYVQPSGRLSCSGDHTYGPWKPLAGEGRPKRRRDCTKAHCDGYQTMYADSRVKGYD